MSQPFIGEIIAFGGNFAPRSWALCQGQLLAISSNNALFSILGTTYGGDGRVSFALPDLRGRVAIHSGNNSAGPGLPAYREGAMGGTETATLITTQIPSHNHMMRVRKEAGNVANPNGHTLATSGDPNTRIYTDQADDASLAASAITNSGGGRSHNNLQPYLAVNWIICLFGVFPSRS